LRAGNRLALDRGDSENAIELNFTSEDTMKKLSLILLLVASAGIAEASTNTSQVLDVRLNQSTVTAGNARVSILLSGATSCTGGGGWYAFEYPDSGSGAAMGKAWLASALSALANGRSLTIGGTGACDSFGIETISYIDAL
jgi:hypothetical protein